eukprot:CAMPEP_0180400114 /NCGR_PEP_ID=MMETSP0989-20121125/37542_1 /TAXON_ID=697907 /ORGANISM="non described non described, Strain CCMP2293" /LENGTH=159 /DNA_ID=CAMNT_0022402907 /DNA_START=18 /DNA_END=497 /DNA_ORIENTATION=-
METGGQALGRDKVRGWLYHANGMFTNGISGERVDTGRRWGAEDVIGVTTCFHTAKVSFYANGRLVHAAQGLGPTPIVVFSELGGLASSSQFCAFTPPGGQLPDRQLLQPDRQLPDRQLPGRQYPDRQHSPPGGQHSQQASTLKTRSPLRAGLGGRGVAM